MSDFETRLRSASGFRKTTQVIQAAIDAAAAQGGGIVALPPGVWVCTTIELRSCVTLRLQRGAILQAHTDLNNYPPFHSDPPFEGTRFHLLIARHVHDVTIDGDGIIDGQGEAFWEPPIRDLKAQGIDVSEDIAAAPPHWPIDGPFWRGWKPRVHPLIELDHVARLTIAGITVRNSPGWTVHTQCCDQVRYDGITIDNHLYGPNTDGLDINGCRDVVIANCRISCCDDAIILKATANARSCERIAVTNCVLRTKCAALGLGAETTCGIRDVSMIGCVVEQAIRIVQLEMWEPGIIENVCISNISGRAMIDDDIPMEKVIYIDIQQHARDEPVLGTIRNIIISSITAVTKGRIVLTAQDGALIENVTIRDVHMFYPTIEDSAQAIHHARSSQNSNFNPATRGRNAAVVADNVRGLWLQNVQAQMPAADTGTVAMHGIWCRQVSESVIDCPALGANKAGHADAVFDSCSDIDIRGLKPLHEHCTDRLDEAGA